MNEIRVIPWEYPPIAGQATNDPTPGETPDGSQIAFLDFSGISFNFIAGDYGILYVQQNGAGKVNYLPKEFMIGYDCTYQGDNGSYAAVIPKEQTFFTKGGYAAQINAATLGFPAQHGAKCTVTIKVVSLTGDVLQQSDVYEGVA